MAMTDFRSIDDYLATMPDATRAILVKVRAIIRDELPLAEEVISYQIPAYRQDGVAVVYFAGWKEHFSLYPVGEQFAAAYPEDAEKYALSKGTIRIPLAANVPEALIRKIVRMRKEIAREEAGMRASKEKK